MAATKLESIDDRPDAKTNGRVTKTKPRATRRSCAGGTRLSRAESSRRNAQKSTGPRTAAGKARSRYNALKHGMTAESTLLPGEDAAEFEALRRRLHDDIGARNSLEAVLIDRIACDDWMATRANRAAAAQLAYRLRHQSLKESFAEKDAVIALGQRLLRDVSRARSFHPSEQIGGQYHPARVVAKLENTITGCDWLLQRLHRLKERLDEPGVWLRSDGHELVRLMGKYQSELTADDQVALALLASECVHEDSADHAFAHARAKEEAISQSLERARAEAKAGSAARRSAAVTDEAKPEDGKKRPVRGPARQEHARLTRQLERTSKVLGMLKNEIDEDATRGPCPMSLEKLNPPSVEEARRRLAQEIDEQMLRIRQIVALRREILAEDIAEAARRLAFEPGSEGDKQRRYVLSRGRLLIQSIKTFIALRKASNDGTLDGQGEGDDDRDEADLEIDALIGPQSPLGPDNSSSAPVVAVGQLADPSLVLPATDPATPDQQDAKMPESAEQIDTQTPAAETLCGEKKILRNEAEAHGQAPQTDQPADVAGTVPVPSSPLASQLSAPAVVVAGTVPVPSSPLPNPSSPIEQYMEKYGKTGHPR